MPSAFAREPGHAMPNATPDLISVHSPSLSRRRSVTKPALHSKAGIVVAQNRIAATIGAEVLKAGGNAVDAAVATGFAIGVVEPWMSGIGGVGMALVSPADGAAIDAFDFGGVSPTAINPADFPLAEGAASEMFGWPSVTGDRNIRGASAVVTPSQPAGLAALHAAYGRMPWADLVKPAEDLARDGLYVDWYATLCIAGAFADLLADPGSQGWFLPARVPPSQPLHNTGRMQRLPNPKLAETLAALGREGVDALYLGEIGASIARDVQAAGGYLARQDLETYRVRRVVPQAIPYRNRLIHVLPELNGGPTLAVAYGAMPAAAPADDAALFLAYADAMDAAWKHRFGKMGHGGEHRAPTSTTHFSVVDRDGMAVTLTQTLLSIFGARFVCPTSGIAMNNGMNWFDPRPTSPNRIAPGVRTLGNFCPAIMTGKDEAGVFETVAIGGAGGRKILPAVFQILALMADRGIDLETALARPRLDHSAGARLVVDARLDEAVKAAVAGKYPTVETLPNPSPYPFTIASAVSRKAGLNTGMTDMDHPWSEAVGEAELQV
jgi:gamma-glutamyltranspeptidase / glutathione hydrolase